MNAQHSKKSVEHGTPVEIVKMARRVLGGRIHCDPCSNEYWNRHTVKADVFYDETSSPLRQFSMGDGPVDHPSWKHENYFINPPGGLVKEFFSWAVGRWLHGANVFWVGFSLEQLAYLQREPWLAMRTVFWRTILPRRLAFLKRGMGKPVAQKSPTHSNYLMLMPGNRSGIGAGIVRRFQEEAAKLGAKTW